MFHPESAVLEVPQCRPLQRFTCEPPKQIIGTEDTIEKSINKGTLQS